MAALRFTKKHILSYTETCVLDSKHGRLNYVPQYLIMASPGRPKLPKSQKKQRVSITLNKSVYKNCKNQGYALSKLVNGLLANFLQYNVGEMGAENANGGLSQPGKLQALGACYLSSNLRSPNYFFFFLLFNLVM